jgi:hypothetical protein
MLQASNDAWAIIGKFIRPFLTDLRFVYPFVSKLFALRASRLWTPHAEKRAVEQKVDSLNLKWITKHADAMRKMYAFERVDWVAKFPKCASLGLTMWPEIPTIRQIPTCDLFPNLRELTLLNIDSLLCFETGFGNLRHLTLSGAFESVKSLENLSHLESLILAHCDNLVSVKELASCTSLRFLELHWCQNLALIYQVEFVSISACPRLKHSALLDLEHVTALHWQLAWTWSTMAHVPAYSLASQFSHILIDFPLWQSIRAQALGFKIYLYYESIRE